jgi:hypothetical protein
MPPALLAVEPDSGAVNVRADEVSFHFDDVINEGAGSSDGLSRYFLISPRHGDVKVDWHRSTLDVHPDDGFAPNTAYTITMLPGVGDLRGNARTEGASIVFSTGPTIPNTRIGGTLFDWEAGKPVANGAIEALARPDTQLVYVTQADSLGHFVVAHMQPGTYTVRGFVDANHNNTLDPREIWDTTHVVLRDTVRTELLAFAHDTVGPIIATLDRTDSLTLRVKFDHGIDPAQTIDTSLFQVKTADSTVVPIRRATPAREWDKAKAYADSIVRADSMARADSLAAQQDTSGAARRDTSGAARRDTTVRDTTRRDTTRRAVGVPPSSIRPASDTAQADTTAAPTPSRPVPVSAVVIELGRALQPGQTYRLTVTGVRGLLGATHESSRTIEVPTLAPPADTTGRG